MKAFLFYLPRMITFTTIILIILYYQQYRYHHHHHHPHHHNYEGVPLLPASDDLALNGGRADGLPL